MEYSVSYLEEYKVVRRVEIVVDADSEEEALERAELGEFDAIFAAATKEDISDELVYKDLAMLTAEAY